MTTEAVTMNGPSRPAGGRREIAPLYEQLRAFEIIDEWMHENEQSITEAGGEIPAELQQLLDHVGQDFDDKVERIGLKLQADKAEVAMLDTEISRLTARRSAIEHRDARLKRYLLFCMPAAGREKVKGLLCSVAVQQASNPALTVQDPRQLPDTLQTVVPETRLPNRDAILDAWKANGKGWRSSQHEAAGVDGKFIVDEPHRATIRCHCSPRCGGKRDGDHVLEIHRRPMSQRRAKAKRASVVPAPRKVLSLADRASAALDAMAQERENITAQRRRAAEIHARDAMQRALVARSILTINEAAKLRIDVTLRDEGANILAMPFATIEGLRFTIRGGQQSIPELLLERQCEDCGGVVWTGNLPGLPGLGAALKAKWQHPEGTCPRVTESPRHSRHARKGT
jgi:hypothetical protein